MYNPLEDSSENITPRELQSPRDTEVSVLQITLYQEEAQFFLRSFNISDCSVQITLTQSLAMQQTFGHIINVMREM